MADRPKTCPTKFSQFSQEAFHDFLQSLEPAASPDRKSSLQPWAKSRSSTVVSIAPAAAAAPATAPATAVGLARRAVPLLRQLHQPEEERPMLPERTPGSMFK